MNFISVLYAIFSIIFHSDGRILSKTEIHHFMVENHSKIHEHKISLLNEQILTNILEPLRSNNAKFPPMIVLKLKFPLNATGIRPYYSVMDKYFTSRPWWMILQYPIHDQDKIISPLIIQHIPSSIQTKIDHIVNANFPANEQACLLRPMVVKTGVGSWGNDVTVNFKAFFRQYMEYIHGVFITNHGCSTDLCGFVESKSCLDQTNKHLCTFLSTTNCSFPVQLMTCNHSNSYNREGIYSDRKRKFLGSHVITTHNHNPSLFYPDYFEIDTF
jgi:hypothetical protein